MASTSSYLRKAKALIETEEQWSVGAYARNSKGKEAMVHKEAAVKFCLVGSLLRVCDGETKEFRTCKSELEISMGHAAKSLAAFNDRYSHAEVLELIYVTIKRLKNVRR